MILFGFAGVVTSFTRHFFGVATSEEHTSTVADGAIGLFYVVSGLLILTKRKSAVGVAIVLLALDVVGRMAIVAPEFRLLRLRSCRRVCADGAAAG